MTKKLLKYGKIMMALSLIGALTLPSYATVGAADGSAFVTKAEFDAALSDFNARLTTFEAGINSKIDSQVSSYLDRNGIWNGKIQTYYTYTNSYSSSSLVHVLYAMQNSTAYLFEQVVVTQTNKTGLMYLVIDTGGTGVVYMRKDDGITYSTYPYTWSNAYSYWEILENNVSLVTQMAQTIKCGFGLTYNGSSLSGANGCGYFFCFVPQKWSFMCFVKNESKISLRQNFIEKMFSSTVIPEAGDLWGSNYTVKVAECKIY